MSSGEATRIGGTEINLPDIHRAQDELFKAIFGPAADAIGRQLAANMQRSRFDGLSAQEAQNLRQQSKSVLGEPDARTPIDPTRKQRDNLVDWIDEASDTNPEKDPENAAKWQAILDEILNRNDLTVINTLKALNKYDVRALHNLEESGGELSGGQSVPLLNTGIVEKRNPINNKFELLLLTFGLAAAIPVMSDGSINLLTTGSSIALGSDTALVESVRQLFIFGSIIFFGFAGFRIVGLSKRYYFTELGQEIKKKIDQYYL